MSTLLLLLINESEENFKKVIAYLKSQGAISPATAVKLKDFKIIDPPYKWKFLDKGIKRVGTDKYYLDEPMYADYLHREQRFLKRAQKAWVIVAIACALLIIGVFIKGILLSLG